MHVGSRNIGPLLVLKIIFLVICWTGLHTSSVVASADDDVVKGIVGGSAELPCDVDQSNCGKVYFITWTKNVSNEWKRLYLYSDAVEKPLQELANPDRADFFLGDTTASLTISPVRIEDDGTYKCDVTYVQGKCPSLSFATLVTYAPPSHPEIDKDGKISPNGSIVGPFYQGNNMSLTCGTSDGKPTPEVSWFKGSEELDSETHVHVEKNGASTVKSRVNVTLKREDLGAKIECHVDNDAIDDPLVSWVEIDLHVPPLSLEVEGPTSPVIAGELVSLTCTIEGAKPAANATWYNKSDVINVMPQTHTNEAPDGTLTTISTVQVPVSRYDHLGTFYCKGTNYVLQGKEAPLLKSLDIQVLYPPAVVMQPVNGVIVNESDSAIIYCTYEANPFNVTDVLWFHEDELLTVPTQEKYEMSMQGYPALTIRNVRKEDRGFYSCSLANDIGRGNATNYAEINVLFPPIVEATISPEDAKEGDSISLFCDILEGNPQNLKRVRWYRYEDFLHETTEREIVWVGASRNTSGVYSCEGQNTAGWGERSEPKELIVRYLPGPADLIELDPPAIKGETATLHCDVEEPGLPPVSVYRWEKNGGILATTSSENYTTDVLGVGSKGNYTCAAINDVGIGPKSTEYLPVYAPPTFIHDLPEIRGAARDSPFISFECRVECEPLCEIFWMKDGVKVTNSELYIIRNRVLPEDHLNNYFRSISSSLQFNMTAWPGRRLERDRDRANYTCFSTPNDVGDGVSSSMLFLVEYPPELMSLSENVVRVREGNVPPDVECSASSWPPSTYLWLRDTKVLARDDTLSFNQSVTREHMGTYICVAENSHGKSQIELRLEVLYKPNCFIIQDRNEAENEILRCKADGFPTKINYTWSKDNETLDDYELENDYDDYSVYTLPRTPASYGEYVCIAINDVGRSEPCKITVNGADLAGWHAEFGDKNVLVIAAIIGSIAILFVLAIIIIILIMRKRRLRNFGSPGKAPLGGTGDSLYQNVSGTSADPKQNGPPNAETEGNVMYENMPFHRQGPVPSFSSARMRQSLPADFSRAYQNVLYCRQDWNSPPPHAQWNNADQRRTSSGSAKREPCPQHGLIPDSPEWAEVLPHPRENGGSTQKCPNPSAVIYADLALPYHRSPPIIKEATKYATLKFTSEAAKALQTGQQ